ADVEDPVGWRARHGFVEERQAPLGAAVVSSAEGAARLDHDRVATRHLGLFPRRLDPEPAPDGPRWKGLLPRARPCLLAERRDLDIARRGRESERPERIRIAHHRGRELRRGSAVREERAQTCRRGGALLLHDSKGALLPEEVRQAFGGFGGDWDGDLPEGHQLPKSFFIRSRKEETNGPEDALDASRSSSRSSCSRCESLLGTSTMTSYTALPRPRPRRCGMPLPLSIKRWPGCGPGGTTSLALPSSTGTSPSSPRHTCG